MDALLWVLAVLMIGVGIAGVVLPALPGVVLVFGGVVLGAWIDDFARVSVTTVMVLGVLTAIGFAVDYVTTVLYARKAGATKLGMLGAAVGTVLGIFMGFIGVLLMPLIGAAVGEFIAHRDALRAGQVGVATWVGLLVAVVAKLAIVFTMVGIFVVALIF